MLRAELIAPNETAPLAEYLDAFANLQTIGLVVAIVGLFALGIVTVRAVW